MFQVFGDIWAENTGKDLILRRGLAAVVQTSLVFPGHTVVPEHSVTLNATFVPQDSYESLRSTLGACCVAFDASVTDGTLLVRTPKPGDRLRPLGMGGQHKKLSDCFIDAKWPRILRSDALALTHAARGSEEEVLWVAGLIRSEAFRVTPDTDRILYLEFVAADSSEAGAPNPPTDGPTS